MQGTLGRTGPVSHLRIRSQEEQVEREVPELLSKLAITINEAQVAVNDLIDRLGPLRATVSADRTLSESSSKESKSPIGEDLNAKISQLRALTNAVRSVTNELAI